MNLEKKLEKIEIPPYTKKQELFNSLSHLFGVPIGLGVIVFATIFKVQRNLSIPFLVGLLIFGFSTIFLYLVSGIYHGTNKEHATAKKLLRLCDHSTIYILIAGTYTPICIYLFINNHICGLVMLILEWVLALFGAAINLFDFKNRFVRIISMILYIGLGWMVFYSASFIYIPINTFILLLVGGILYTIGSILYGIGHKDLNFHSVFHVFVLLGTIAQAIGVLLLFM